MKRLLLILLLILVALPARAAPLNMNAFREIPVLNEGRVKPLESFARIYLLAVYGHDELPDQSAISWLAELLFDQHKAFTRDVFNIPDPQTVAAIGLEWRPEHHYSFIEVSKALAQYGDVIKTLSEERDEELTSSQRQLLDLYAKTLTYGVIAQSLTVLTPQFQIDDEQLATTLHLPAHQTLTYLDLMPHEEQIVALVKGLEGKNPEQLTPHEHAEAKLALGYLEVSGHKQSALFRIVPPQWGADNGEWSAPWATLFEGHGSPQSAAYLDLWKKLAADYAAKDNAVWQRDTVVARDKSYELAGSHASPARLQAEIFYQDLQPFDLALVLYLASCASLAVAFIANRKRFIGFAAAGTALGAVLQFLGVSLRIFIQNRPPVSTLYETTIFVSLIAVVLSLIFAWKRRDALVLAVGSVIGAVLLFISTRYAANGDTMEMLVAVLNTNFWLATHVVAITTGYGCTLVAGTLAHIYLVNVLLKPKDKAEQGRLLNAVLAVALIAAFFATLGTILGGIWADQSWGRFWGWDPKENGAMFIVLWLLWLLHGRIANVLSPVNFATCAAAANIVVALSWFGVNLLSVGLHSYGFTHDIAANLAFFCGAELLFILGMRAALAIRRIT
ncbi:MAG TPA: cytochrome c biogenesis protein CcsA [Alphaproteobacteria bacterium]|nr:cytochrome c biogenesis protein CcsA [Alphaproteobacteria bacterium]